jgi:hypothetical protein
LACALLRARREAVRLLILDAPPAHAVPRVEVVPAAALALLVELGVHPHTLGVESLTQRRLLAWESLEPLSLTMPDAAHILRPALEQALWGLAIREKVIEIRRVAPDAVLHEARKQTRAGAVVIDATGRRAALAQALHRPRRPWAARIFHVACGKAPAPFMAAALADGYVYRVQGQGFATLGVVGRGALLRGGAADIVERLSQSTARWMVEDIYRHVWRDAGTWPAAMQWSQDGDALAIGDAALARDALSSQGLANGLSDACHAAAAGSGDDLPAVRRRITDGRKAHARALAAMIGACYWREQALWRSYAAFFASFPFDSE